MKRKTVSLIIAFVVVISIFLHSWLTGDYKVGFHEPKDLSDLFSLITRAPISFILLIVIIVVFSFIIASAMESWFGKKK